MNLKVFLSCCYAVHRKTKVFLNIETAIFVLSLGPKLHGFCIKLAIETDLMKKYCWAKSLYQNEFLWYTSLITQSMWHLVGANFLHLSCTFMISYIFLGRDVSFSFCPVILNYRKCIVNSICYGIWCTFIEAYFNLYKYWYK